MDGGEYLYENNVKIYRNAYLCMQPYKAMFSAYNVRSTIISSRCAAVGKRPTHTTEPTHLPRAY